MKRRSFLGMAAAGAGGGLAVSGCGAGASAESVTLRMVAADYGEPRRGNSTQGYWDALVRKFNQRYPGVAVDVTVLSWKDVDKRVAAMVAEGRAPDIAQLGSYADYAAGGKLYSADELLSIPVQADFLPRLAEAGKVERVQYGLPFAASTRLLFYNRKLFAKAGLDPSKPPRDWGQLVRTARRLKAAGVRVPYGLPLGREEAPAEALMWVLGGGGGYTDKAGAWTIDAPANIRTFEWMRENLVGRGLTNRSPGSTDRQDVFDAFTSGRVGMLNGHPKLMKEAAAGGVDYGTAVLPGDEGPADTTLGVADWIMAFKQGGRREEAGRFLEFVFEERNHYTFVDRYDLLPVTTSANERMRAAPEHKRLRRFQDQLPGAEFYPVGKVSWARVSRELKTSVGNVLERGTDPAAVLGVIQRKAEAEDSATRAR
ncbi:extracellular solute-binding protein [Streptomyces sp. WMMB 714]|uniref:extracellular solute-binding protein n=1 Tax=Streptomyces sp. WMMB 714 TaxID=1286822 RepID=UPI0005F789EC|nr:extracellular solute-binding protein [Streptomyces sp. WMMB 714]